MTESEFARFSEAAARLSVWLEEMAHAVDRFVAAMDDARQRCEASLSDNERAEYERLLSARPELGWLDAACSIRKRPTRTWYQQMMDALRKQRGLRAHVRRFFLGEYSAPVHAQVSRCHDCGAGEQIRGNVVTIYPHHPNCPTLRKIVRLEQSGVCTQCRATKTHDLRWDGAMECGVRISACPNRCSSAMEWVRPQDLTRAERRRLGLRLVKRRKRGVALREQRGKA